LLLLTDAVSFIFVFAEKMKKDLGALVNAASKKITAKKKRKNVQSLEHLISGSGPSSTPGPVVDLDGEEPSEELVQDSAKRQRVRVPSEDPITLIKAVPVRSEKGDFFSFPGYGPSRSCVAPNQPFSWMIQS
jgi:hypothetical protein